jgi:hypothetical protein
MNCPYSQKPVIVLILVKILAQNHSFAYEGRMQYAPTAFSICLKIKAYIHFLLLSDHRPLTTGHWYLAFMALPAFALLQAKSKMWIGLLAHSGLMINLLPLVK